MASGAAVAKDSFKTCEAGKSWELCRVYCAPDAGFSAQAEPLRSLQQYTERMKGLLHALPDARYVVKSFTVERRAQQLWRGFPGGTVATAGPRPPTGKSTNTDYVCVMEFVGRKIPERQMTDEGTGLDRITRGCPRTVCEPRHLKIWSSQQAGG